jgi:hypothetical protein
MWCGNVIPMSVSPPVKRWRVMNNFQSLTFSKYRALTKALVYDVPFSTSCMSSFNESMFVLFNVFDMMLKHWSMSSCVCPIIRKHNCTSWKYPNPTRTTHRANIYIFLFSQVVLSIWIRNIGGNLPFLRLTSAITCIIDVMMWLLSCLWCASIYTSAYKPIPCISTPHKWVFTKQDSMFFTICLILETMVVFWSTPSIRKHMKRLGVIIVDLLNNH